MTMKKRGYTDTERLNYLIKTGNRVLKDKGAWWVITIGTWGESATPLKDNPYRKTPRAAIDAAMERRGHGMKKKTYLYTKRDE